ncbi:MAG: MMPL family transporter [Planctomycetaceae bacterium]
MKRLLERRDAWGNPAAVWVIAAAAFLVPLIGYGLTFVHLENHVEHWLPEGDPLSRTFAWYKRHFPSDEKVLVSWRGARLGDPRIERLAAELRGTTDDVGVRRGGSRYVAEVLTPDDAVEALTQHDVTRDEGLRRLTGLLVGLPKEVGESTRPAALIVTLSGAGEADHSGAVDSLLNAAEAADIPRAELALGGSAVAGNSLNAALRQTLWNDDAPPWMLHRSSPLLLSLLVAVGVAFVLLRSIRVAALVLGATMLATLGAVALVPATGGGMNMVLVLMPTLMMVLTISAAIHFIHYRDRAARMGEADPAAAAVRAAWSPTIIAETTTAIGLISLISSPLAPIRDFGVYAAVGCILLLPVVLWVMPAAMQLWTFPVATESRKGGRGWRRLGYLLVRRRRFVMVASLMLLAAGIGGLYWFRTETRAIRYLPPQSDVVRDYEFLERELAGIVPVEVVVAFDETAQKRLPFAARMELIRSVTESLRAHSEVSGALSLADFLPATPRPPADASFATKAKYYRRSSIAEDRAKAEDAAAGTFLAVCETSPAATSSIAGSMQKGDELWRVTAHASMMSDIDLSQLVAEFESTVQSQIADEPGTTYVVTGAVPLFLRTQQALLDSLVWSFATGFVMISAVIAWMLRSIWAGTLAMLPNVLPVAMIFGTVSACGMAFDVGTMISASIAIGIAVDGTLHLCEVFKDEHSRGVSRRRAVADTLAACGPALWKTVLVVSGGWMMLCGADLLLVSHFGGIMAVLVATALIGDLILLPALLAGPLGRVLTRQKSRARPVVETAATDGRLPAVPAPHAWSDRRLAAAGRSAYTEK